MPHVQRNGVSVYYESHGQGTPIVFLHPFSTNGNIWYFQHYTFAQDYQCIIVDHRGHGRSDKPEQGYAISEMAADVAAILDELKIDKTILVGNSIGGMIAMQFNLDFPARVLGNVIVSSGTNLSAGMPPDAGEAFQKDLNGAFSGLMEGAVSAKTKRERPEILDLVKAKFMVDDNFPKHVFFSSAGDPNGVFQWNISDRLKDISKPTQIFAGKEDQATTVEANQFLADNIPNATIKVIPDVGHFYQLEKSAEFNDDLRSFLKQVTA
jgi:pimeloyl-ACP methyl ester carboxylesterase